MFSYLLSDTYIKVQETVPMGHGQSHAVFQNEMTKRQTVCPILESGPIFEAPPDALYGKLPGPENIA